MGALTREAPNPRGYGGTRGPKGKSLPRFTQVEWVTFCIEGTAYNDYAGHASLVIIHYSKRRGQHHSIDVDKIDSIKKEKIRIA